jgi:hypothetical protein
MAIGVDEGNADPDNSRGVTPGREMPCSSIRGIGRPGAVRPWSGRAFRTKLFERPQRPQKTVREGFGKNVGKQQLQSTANPRFGAPRSRRLAEFQPPVPTLRIFHHVAPAQHVVQICADVANTAPS